MAKISLTIPVIAFASVWIELPLLLGWTPTQRVLFVLTVIVAVVTVVPEQGDATAGHSAPRTVGRLHVSRNQPLAPPARAIRPTPTSERRREMGGTTDTDQRAGPEKWSMWQAVEPLKAGARGVSRPSDGPSAGRAKYRISQVPVSHCMALG